MFAEALDELVAATGGEFAIFCDYEGESIAFAARGQTDYDVRLAGAHLGASVFALLELAQRTGQDSRASVSYRTAERSLLVEALPGNYYLLLSLPCTALEPCARRRLREVAQRFEAEL